MNMKNAQKGFIGIIVLIIIVVLVAGGIYFFIFSDFGKGAIQQSTSTDVYKGIENASSTKFIGYHYMSVFFSPATQYAILEVQGVKDNSKLLLLDLSTLQTKIISEGKFELSTSAVGGMFSPSGTKIVYAVRIPQPSKKYEAESTAYHNVYVYDIATGQSTLLSKDQRYVYFAGGEGDTLGWSNDDTVVYGCDPTNDIKDVIYMEKFGSKGNFCAATVSTGAIKVTRGSHPLVVDTRTNINASYTPGRDFIGKNCWAQSFDKKLCVVVQGKIKIYESYSYYTASVRDEAGKETFVAKLDNLPDAMYWSNDNHLYFMYIAEQKLTRVY